MPKTFIPTEYGEIRHTFAAIQHVSRLCSICVGNIDPPVAQWDKSIAMRAPRFTNVFALPADIHGYNCPIVSLPVVRSQLSERGARALCDAVKLWQEANTASISTTPNDWMPPIGTNDVFPYPHPDAVMIREAALRIMTKVFWQQLSDHFNGFLSVYITTLTPAEALSELSLITEIPPEMLREVLDGFPSFFEDDTDSYVGLCVESVLDIIITLRDADLLEPPYNWEHPAEVVVLNGTLQSLVDFDWIVPVREDDVHGSVKVWFGLNRHP